MTATSIATVIAQAQASNNGRLNSLAMTAGEIRCAEKAVARGLMTKHFATMPGYGPVSFFQLVA